MTENFYPGPRSQEIIEKTKKFGAPTTQDFSFVPSTRAEGCWVRSVDGEKCFDASCGPGVFNIGHNHPKFARAMLGALPGFGANEYPNPWAVELAEKLTHLTPGGFEKLVFFSNSGTEANEAAVRAVQIARPNRPYFIHFEKAFHGRTLGSRTLTNRLHVNLGSRPAFPEILLPFPEVNTEMGKPEVFLTHVKKQLSNYNLDEVAAIIWEPVQGEGGIRITDSFAWNAFLREFIYPNGIIIIADEVQTGFGRTGKWFACEHFRTFPDIITSAKGIGSGAHIGATIMKKDLCWPEGGLYSNTWGGDPLTSKAALITIGVIEEEKLVERAWELGQKLELRLEAEICSRIKPSSSMIEGTGGQHPAIKFFVGNDVILALGGLGLMRYIRFEDASRHPLTALRNAVRQEARKRSILMLGSGDSTLRIMPPLVIKEDEIQWLAENLADAIKTAISG